MTQAFRVRADMKAINRTMGYLPKEVIQKAVTRAINETATTVRKEIAPELQRVRPLTSSGAKNTIDMKRATWRNQRAELSVKGGPISLKYYGARQSASGVRVRITSNRRKLVRREGKTAFKGKAKLGGHIYASNPLRGQRPKIFKIMGPSLPSAFRRRDVEQKMDQIARRTFPARYRRNLNHLLGQYFKR